MKTILLTLLVFAYLFGYSQNVGIGTTVPAAKMQINSTATLGRPTLKLYDSSTTSGATIEFQNASGTNYWQMGGKLHDTDPTQSLFAYFTNSNPFVLLMRGDGNIGIGASNPQHRLHVYSDAGLQNSFALFNNLATGNLATDGLIAGINGTGHAIINNQEAGRSLFLGTTGLNRLSIASSGNVGIGIDAPSAPLHIRTSAFEVLRLEGNDPYVSFFDGTTYKGYLWYDGAEMVLGTSTNEPVIVQANYNSTPAYFTANGRLGLGQSAPTERLDVNGNINLTGLLKVNGNGGGTGQVLTSNGASDPTWTNAALTNNVRFAVEFNEGPTSGDYADISATRYNLNTTDVVIGANSITINRSGLYHFDIGASGTAGFASGQTIIPIWSIWFYYGLPNPFRIIDSRLMGPTSNTNTNWRASDKVSIDVYITAPATIRLLHTYSGTFGITSYSLGAFMTCHLISE